MIKSVSVTNHLGERMTMELTRPEQSGFVIKKIDGIGPVVSDILTSETATTDGAIFNSARRSKRNIVLELIFYGNEIEELRHKSYQFFPGKKKIALEFETDTRTVGIEGYVESNEPNIFESQENTSISIICPDPHFYLVGGDGINTTIFGSVEPLFEFPFESEADGSLEFGELQTVSMKNIYYKGEEETGVTITIHALGTASNITIHNVTTNEIMRVDTDKMEQFTGKSLVYGDDIVINTEKGNKSAILIRDGIPTNILNCLDKATDWISLVNGDNLFAYTADAGANHLSIQIQNRIIYEGV